MSVQRVLVVDDEESILKVIDYALTQEGFDVRTAADAEGAEFLLAQIPVDLVILDVMLPSKSGLEIARDLRAPLEHPDHHALRPGRRGRPHPRARVRRR